MRIADSELRVPPGGGGANIGQWEVLRDAAGGDQIAQVLAIHAALLHTGKVLYFGGDEHDPQQNTAGNQGNLAAIEHTRLFDCATLTVEMSPSPTTDVFCSGHAFLSDGRLLVAGGTEQFPREPVGIHHDHFPGLRDCWTFDPSAGQWAKMADMNPGPLTTDPNTPKDATKTGGRWYPTLVTLPTGRVLAVSGHPGSSDARHSNDSPEVFDPRAGPIGAWRLLGPNDPAHSESFYPRLHVVPPNGEVFSATPVAGRTQIFNPETSTWRDVCDRAPDPDGTSIYDGYAGTAVLLPLIPGDGYRARILLCGGRQPVILDLGAAPPSWRPTTPRALPNARERRNLSAILLPTGQVFVCGGVEGEENPDGSIGVPDASAVLDTELYDPRTDTWSVLARATVVRNYHSVALLMPDGRVWTAGSDMNGGQGQAARELRIEIYSPRYLFSGERPAIRYVPRTPIFSTIFEIGTRQANRIQSVAIIRCGSSTHAFNPDQRYVGLSIQSRSSTAFTVVSPPNDNVAPPGYYLLFIVDDRGVPSIGEFIRVVPRPSGLSAPTVIPPADVTVPATEAGGARARDSRPLDSFLFTPLRVVDPLDPSPIYIGPAISRFDPVREGIVIREATREDLFPIGITTVTFRAQNTYGLVGTATANVTVILGRPQLFAVIQSQGALSSTEFHVDLMLTNIGTGNAQNILLNQVLTATVRGNGKVTYRTAIYLGQPHALPLAIEPLVAGASSHVIRLIFGVPQAVTEFSIVENMAMQDAAGMNVSFAIAQAVIPS